MTCDVTDCTAAAVHEGLMAGYEPGSEVGGVPDVMDTWRLCAEHYAEAMESFGGEPA